MLSRSLTLQENLRVSPQSSPPRAVDLSHSRILAYISQAASGIAVTIASGGTGHCCCRLHHFPESTLCLLCFSYLASHPSLGISVLEGTASSRGGARPNRETGAFAGTRETGAVPMKNRCLLQQCGSRWGQQTGVHL